MTRAVGIGCVLGLILGCGGVAGDATSASGEAATGNAASASAGQGSDAAQKLCAYLAKEKETPCTALGAVKELEMEGFKVVLNEVSTWTHNGNVRQDPGRSSKLKSAGGNTLVVDASYTNTGPMKVVLEPKMWLVTPEGELASQSYYLDQIYYKEHADKGFEQLGSRTLMTPNKPARTATAFIVPADLVKGSLLYMATNEKRRDPDDPRGRKKLFWNNLVVIDLGPPT